MMWKPLFQQVCLSALLIVSTSCSDVQEWKEENEWDPSTPTRPDMNYMRPVTNLQEQEAAESSPAQEALTLVPGPVFDPDHTELTGLDTMVHPQRKQFREYEPRTANSIITTWGKPSEGPSPYSHLQEEEDNEPSSNEPIYYAYEYKVQDPLTGDVKGHKEMRDGDRVKGYYMLHDADGSMREVHYTADHEVGFTAIVSKTDDVAPPFKHKTHSEDFFAQDPVSPPVKTITHHGTKSHSPSAGTHYLNPTDTAPQSFFSSSFFNNEPFHDDDRRNQDYRVTIHHQNDDEARQLEQFHPTPSYEEAYNSFAKKQPMPSLQNSYNPYSNDAEDDENETFNDEEDNYQFPRQHIPYRLFRSRNPRLHDPENISDLKVYRNKGKGLTINHKNNAHSFQYRDSHPVHETHENERDYANDESRPSFSVIPSIRPSTSDDYLNGASSYNSYAVQNNKGSSRSSINSTLLLQSLLPSSPTSPMSADNAFKTMHVEPSNRVSYKDSYSNFSPYSVRSYGGIGEKQGDSYSSVPTGISRPQRNPSQHFFGPNLESGFKPMFNNMYSPSHDHSQYGTGSYKSSAYRNNKPASSPDNSKIKTLKNNNFNNYGGFNFDTFNKPKNKLKKGYFEDYDYGKWPNSRGNRWGKDLRGDLYDDLIGDSVPTLTLGGSKGFDKGKPKRETLKNRLKSNGYTRKGAYRRQNSKPKVTSIYDVMAYGGSDWPKKIRSSKKPRNAYRGFSNRRYNEGKRKRSIVQDGYFPDRENTEMNDSQQPPSLDYEYLNNF